MTITDSSPFISEKFKDLNLVLEQHKEEYQNNLPFPHISFDDFLAPNFLDSVLDEFPDLAKAKAISFSNPNENGKFAAKGEGLLGENTRRLVHYFNSQPFLEFLQELTGIKETLLPDPYLHGGGYHEIKPNGFLKLHVDFHKHQLTKLDRRINLLVYLNKDWEESYGGHFELWERDMSKSAVKIAPLFNKVAIFNTTGDSWHGHPDPLSCPEDRSRKSLALYYYTNGRPANEIKDEVKDRITTTFAGRKGQDSSKMMLYNRLSDFALKIIPSGLLNEIKKLRNK